jgi:two-component system, sensor histidine kinase RegB
VIGSLILLASILLTVTHLPLHGGELHSASQTLIRPMGLFAANALGIAITAGYAWVATSKARGMKLALDVTQTVLAREQKLSALGALAVAAAHELGTPLATIAVVAGEMARKAKPDDDRADVELMIAQTVRCREIRAQLTAKPVAADDPPPA